MNNHTTSQTESFGRLSPEQLAETLERNAGRLEVVVLACRGLIHETGKDALCLGWVLADVLGDLESIEGMIRDG